MHENWAHRGFFVTVIGVCVLLLLWMVATSTSNYQIFGLLQLAVRSPRPYSNSSLWPGVRPPNRKVSLLGKQVERCLTGADDIYIAIKTTHKNHKTRVPVLILTWLQTVKPEQVNS